MHTILYRFKDKTGKTRAKAVVTFNGEIAIDIQGTATELQLYAAIDGGADHVGALTIESADLDEKK